jgi:hypothetical protein
LAAYHAHVSQLQPYCVHDTFLPDFGQSHVCEHNLWHIRSNWKGCLKHSLEKRSKKAVEALI